MKNTLKSIASFSKIEHTIFSLPLVLTGAWFGMNETFPNIIVMVLIIIASFGARIFGISFNRIFDRNIDALNPRTSNRELPSGKMNVKNALFVAFSGLFLYILSCAALGELCLKLSFIPLIPLLIYSLLKRFTFLCHFGIGFCLALAPLAAFIAAAGHAKFTLPTIMFSIFVFCWLSGTDIIYSMMDIESDRINNIKSLPARFGILRAQLISAFFHGIAIFCIGFIVVFLDGNFSAWICFFITIVLLFTMYVPLIPISIRFFPLSSFAAIAGSITSILA